MTRTLLERLKGPPRTSVREVPPAERRGEASPQDSVCENLRQLLNSRLDMADACDDYGLTEPAEIVRDMPEKRVTMEAAIKDCIEKFEPRLTHVRVSQIDNPDEVLAVSFRIFARLKSDRSEEDVWFETVVAASGRIRVTTH